MPGKQKTPDQSTQAVILREAGYTLPAIAERLNISLSTTQRLLKRHGAVAGAASQALIQKAREDLLQNAFALEAVQQVAASLVLDDLSLGRLIRNKLAQAVEALEPTSDNAPIVCRALAASATTLKLTQDVGRRALPLDKLNQALDVEDLPELVIHVMTEDDVLAMRAQQRKEDAGLDGIVDDDDIENERWLRQKAVRDDDVISEGILT
ncbi:MAG: helix-turn-helix domain-containing protein [Gammaproteobacteria bacterium]|nr:helix-turn-helix domain-containing protein [Gammaproteobacteria bacterium]MBU1490679.1 helix-turn-helix domain-containing protein [Gammaproteobacteria bacterium]MBU2067287.1 helix-turn-helix domain-containing protein [Gammaproteobacteria bacterium]MBU2140098.1 helix-turn-helix domain-containing protein [Gammaproteobacteria bacterium]MBU2217725.1 helix-turn-helix domain-containing protein [Gammaproteobacteria bacterium]